MARLNAGEKKRGKNNSDMANSGKKSENDEGGGGWIRKNFFIVKIKNWSLTRNSHDSGYSGGGATVPILHLRTLRHQGSEEFSQVPNPWKSWDWNSRF